MKSFISTAVAIFLSLLFYHPFSVHAATQRRTALIIGNGAYERSPLANPVNDASDLAQKLKELGFNVTVKLNAGHRNMEEAIHQFGKDLQVGGTGLFYFAGHGLQVNGKNYLLPVDAIINDEFDVKFEAVDAGRVLARMEHAGNNMNIIILDACRNNPFGKDFRSSAGGLAKMDAPAGSILAYSTAPGSVAYDGAGRNSLYTSKLLKFISESGMSIEDCFKKIRIDVMAESENKQVPWESSSLTNNFYFVLEQPADVQVNTMGSSSAAELLYWESIKDSQDAELYQSYIDEFPTGKFEKIARFYIKKYQPQSAATHSTGKSTVAEKKQTSTAPAAVATAQTASSATSPKKTSPNKQAAKFAADSAKSESIPHRQKPVSISPDRTVAKYDDSAPAMKSIARSGGQVAKDGPLVKYENGIVYDTATGLEWFAASDKNYEYFEADKWVSNLTVDTGGWRLPSLKEIKTLHKKGKGSDNLTSLFALTGEYVYYSEKGFVEAWSFKYSRKKNYWQMQNTFFEGRILAVRVPH